MPANDLPGALDDDQRPGKVKMAEQPKRRRQTIMFFSAFLLAILIGAGAFLLAQRQNQGQQEQTAPLVPSAPAQASVLREHTQETRTDQRDLMRAMVLSEQAQAAPVEDAAQRERAAVLWRDALAAADRAEQTLTDADKSHRATELLAEIRRQAAAAEKDRRMLRQLEQAHDQAREPQEADYARKRRALELVFGRTAANVYGAAFREYGIDVETLNTPEAAERIRQRPIRLRLAFALDDWYFLAPQAARGKLLDLARAIDPDPLRRQVRDAVARKDRKLLQQLTDGTEASELPIPTLILLANVLHEQGLSAKGVQLLKRARGRHPDDFWVNEMLGLHLLAAEPPYLEEAAHCFAAATALRPDSALGWSNLGGVLAMLGRLDEAIDSLREAIRIQPDFLIAYQRIAEVLDEKCELDQALARLREPLRRHADSPLLQTTFGRLLLAQGKFKEAIAVFRNVLARNSEWVDASISLAVALSASGAEREALALLDQVQRSHPDLGLAYEARRAMQTNKADVEGAVAAGRKAVELDPSRIRLWSGLAGALAVQGRYDEALQTHRKAIQMAPHNAAVHVSFADSLRLMGRGSDAEAEHRLALQLNPRSYQAHRGLGVVLFLQRKYKDAEPSFRQAVALRAQDPWSHAYLGMALRFQKDYTAATAAVSEAVRLKPEEGTFHEYLAHIDYDQGRYAEAIPHCRQAVRLREAAIGADHPDTLLALANLGMACREAGQLKEAISPFETTLERGRKRSGGLPASLDWVPAALALTYERAGQFHKAETIYYDAFQQTQKQFGPYDPRTVGALAMLSNNLLKQQRYSDAEPLLRRCLIVREAKQPDHWTTFNTRSELGEALLGQKKFVEAAPLLEGGYEGIKERQDKIPAVYRQERLSEALQRLVRIYVATDQPEKAARWRKKLEEAKAAQKKTKSSGTSSATKDAPTARD